MSEHTKAISVFSEQEQRLLVERVKLAPSRGWIDQYFDLMASLLNVLGCENGDPRLVTSIPEKKYKIPMHLPVVTNARYALSPDLPYAHGSSDVPVDRQYVPREGYLIGIIYGAEFAELPEDYKRAEVAYQGRFSPLVYETTPPPFYLRLKDAKHLLVPGLLREGWINAAWAEIERSKGSPHRRYHQPIVYEAAVNRQVREAILDKAFPPG